MSKNIMKPEQTFDSLEKGHGRIRQGTREEEEKQVTLEGLVLQRMPRQTVMA